MSSWERNVLMLNPFDGDFGCPGDKVFSDKIGVARKQNECHTCGGTISVGEKIRMQRSLFDGAFATYRWCTACCCAMADSWVDNGVALEARYALRRKKELGLQA